MNKFKVGYYSAAAVCVLALGSVIGISLNAVCELVIRVSEAI
ncbi:MAG: hypothetical protein ACRCXB_22085 [Aeromonadaceae bacterium]